MSMIKNGDEVLILRHTTKDIFYEVNKSGGKTF